MAPSRRSWATEAVLAIRSVPQLLELPHPLRAVAESDDG